MSISTSEIKPVSPFINLIDVIASPATALRRISEVNRRSWWLPALLSIVGTILYLWVGRDFIAAEAMKQVQVQLSNMPPDQVEAARPMMERFTQPNFIFATGAATTLIGLALAWAISTLLIYLGAALAGASFKFGGLWPAVIWTWLPLAIRSYVQTLWVVITDSIVLYPGLSRFFATGDTTADQASLLYVAAAQVDLFAVWHLVLIFVLFRAVARLGIASSTILTLLYAVISIGLRLLPIAVGGAFSPS
ncbi:MAG: YIP1 family protein [Caldilineales bacterium]|nr:YIP1 family protein [Caldilineales bacterium]